MNKNYYGQETQFKKGNIPHNIGTEKLILNPYKDLKDVHGFRHNAIQWLRDVTTTKEYVFKGFKPGYIYHYKYIPKHKDTLSYYDGQPLIIFLKPHLDGKTFYGYNIHFIPMKLREEVFKQFRYKNYDKTIIDDASIWVGLSILQKFYPIIIRRYLYTHIREKIYPIPMRLYDIENVKYFPTEKFYKKTSDEIFRIAVKQWRKGK
jgi:hypothetical protein